MTTRIIALCITLVALGAWHDSAKAAPPVCDGESDRAATGWWRFAQPDETPLERFIRLSQQPPDPYPARLSLYVTLRHGFSYLPDCSAGDDDYLLPWIMYPAGLVAESIKTFNVQGTAYHLVEAEYGLRMIVRASDLEAIESDKTYLFPMTTDGFNYCLASSCLNKDRKKLNIFEDNYIIIDYYLPSGQNDRIETPACEYYRGALHVSFQNRRSPIFINPCTDGKPSSHIKIVTLPDAIKSYSRRDFYARYHQADKWFLPGNFPLVDTARECDETRLTEVGAGTKLEGKIGLPDFFIFGLENKSYVEALTKRTHEIDKGSYSFYATYEYIEKNGKRTFRVVEIVSLCDSANFIPIEPYLIRIDYPSRYQMPLSIRILEELKQLDSESAASIKAIIAPSFLGSGQIWLINSLPQYLRLRDRLRKFISTRGVVDPFLKNPRNDAERSDLIDFFTHLVLGAAVRYSEPADVQPPPRLGDRIGEPVMQY